MRRRVLLYSSLIILALLVLFWPHYEFKPAVFRVAKPLQTYEEKTVPPAAVIHGLEEIDDDEVAGADTLENILGKPGRRDFDDDETAARERGDGPAQMIIDPREAYAQFYGVNREYGDDFEGQGAGMGRGYISPEIAALQEMERLGNPNYYPGLIGGVSISEPTPVRVLEGEPTVSPTRTPDPRPERLTGQARGYTMLYLMHPKARLTVEKQVDAMIAAEVNELYIGVLVDGTFGRDFNFLTNIVRKIARAGRSLTLVLYLTNGATMRSFATTTSDAGFNRIDPIEFRSLIRFDSATRRKFIELVRPVVPVFQLNRRLNANSRNFAIVMLEDNLDNESYLAMRSLAAGVIGQRATFIRNPCPDCGVEGSTADTFGDGLELHTIEDIDLLTKSDGFSLDGVGYNLPGENTGGMPDYEETRNLAILAASRGLQYFGLWRFQRQGLSPGLPVIDPGQRTYEVPSANDLLAEIELMRAGLIPINQ